MNVFVVFVVTVIVLSYVRFFLSFVLFIVLLFKINKKLVTKKTWRGVVRYLQSSYRVETPPSMRPLNWAMAETHTLTVL